MDAINKVAISIIICTYNRAESLRQILGVIAKLQVPDNMPSELIVVDNGSSDHTAEVVRSCKLTNMLLHCVRELRRGVTYARNTGMTVARGQILLFTDDDVRPPQDWIQGMCTPILLGKAHAVVGGVRIAPHLMRSWMTPLLQSWFASTEFYVGEIPGTMPGANFAISREILKKVPAFDPELGAGALGFCDDGLFCMQMNKAG